MSIRINQYLSHAGVCSRRQSHAMIQEGRVFINDAHAQIGDLVNKEDVVYVDNKMINLPSKKVYYLYYKPRGIVTNMSMDKANHIVHYIPQVKGLYPVGRLDKMSEGLLLLTNDGILTNALLSPFNNHEKEYRVIVDKPITNEFINTLSSGVQIINTTTKPCEIKRVSSHEFDIVLTQGMNKQIRRMCQTMNYRVEKLVRTRILHLDWNLSEGTVKALSSEDVNRLYQSLNLSSHN